MLVGGSWVAKTGGGIKDVSHDCNDKKKNMEAEGHEMDWDIIVEKFIIATTLYHILEYRDDT